MKFRCEHSKEDLRSMDLKEAVQILLRFYQDSCYSSLDDEFEYHHSHVMTNSNTVDYIKNDQVYLDMNLSNNIFFAGCLLLRLYFSKYTRHV